MLIAITREVNAAIGSCELTFLPRVKIDTGVVLRQHQQYQAVLSSLGCELVTVGQYLRPTTHHLPVVRYYAPTEYPALATLGRRRGLAHVEAGPLVRSSYHAERHRPDPAGQSTGGSS